MPKISLNITEPQANWIDRERKRTGIGKSELIRRILDSWREAKELNKYGKTPIIEKIPRETV